MHSFACLMLASVFCAPPDALQENITTFDPRQVEVQWSGGHWQVNAGSAWTRDFDRSETDARQALRIVRELNLTQFGTIGGLRPTLEYWLANGKAPANSITGLHTTVFDREHLRVEQVLGQWCVRDGRRVLFSFGAHEEDAHQALAVIRKYGFDQVGYLGHPAPVMIYFLAGQKSSQPTNVGASSLAQANAQGNPFARKILHKKGDDSSDPDPASAGANDVPVLPTIRSLAKSNSLTVANEDRVAIDWRRIEVKEEGNAWKVVYGKYVLADLGASASDAHVAYSVARHYRFTEHCLIGRQKVSFSYFLTNGVAPHGACAGAHNTTFRPELLAVRKHDEEWVIAEGTRTLFHFGDKNQEAREALDAIHKYHFDCLCEIGYAPGHLTFLIRNH